MYYSTDESKFQRNLGSAFALGARNFDVELGELMLSLRRLFGFALPKKYLPPDCLGLTLSNDAVNQRETTREEEARKSRAENPCLGSKETLTVDALSRPTRLLYRAVCWYIDVSFEARPIPRLWFLEIVARMPYVSFLCVRADWVRGTRFSDFFRQCSDTLWMCILPTLQSLPVASLYLLASTRTCPAYTCTAPLAGGGRPNS